MVTHWDLASFNGQEQPPEFSSEKRKAETLFTVLTVISMLWNLVVLAVFVVILQKYGRRARKAIVQDLQTVIHAAAAKKPHNNNAVQVWEVTAPTEEKFLQEMAMEKPVRFTAQQLFSFTNNYSTKLGSGGFGAVYKGQFPNGIKIAVKVLNKSVDGAAEMQFMAEMGIMGRTYHINLVRLYGFCHDQYISALVYEYMENGSPDKYLFSETQAMEWEKLHEIAIGTAKGLGYLHEECEQRIIHYDIKPANILMDGDFFPKVGDFGLAKLCNRDNTHVTLTGYRGIPGYSAPEFLLKNHVPITHKCDVYSFGMVLFEIVGRRRNAIVGNSDSLDWFPKHVWEEYEKGELGAMTLTCGIEEKDRESGENVYGGFLVCAGLARGKATDECCGKDAGGRSGDYATSKTISVFALGRDGCGLGLYKITRLNPTQSILSG